MTFVTSFEVLSQPIVPGIPNIPYVTQGAFLQLTNLSPNGSNVIVGYDATPAFVASSGNINLMANYIDQNGNVTMVSADIFLAGQVGFPGVTIPAGGTFIFGVQYILQANKVRDLAGTTPQEGFGTRGVVTLQANAGISFAALATVRQVFQNFDSSGQVAGMSESAYAAPIVGGPVITF